MSVFNELWSLIKPMINQYTEGQTIPKFLVKAGIKQATKLTPNLSKTLLYGKDHRSDLMSAFIKLLTGNDDLSKQFRMKFAEACKVLNLKTSLLLDEKVKIAAELNKQDEHKEDMVNKMSNTEATEIVNDIIDDVVDNTTTEIDIPIKEEDND